MGTALALVLVSVTACGVLAGCGGRHGRHGSRANGELTIWLTGYSWQDNTPPRSAIVSAPILHKQAGGQGTFTDPITVAVHGGIGDMDFPAGTKFYLPSVKRYVIVEDTGASPAPSGTDGHLDMWIGGEGGTREATDACMNRFTSTDATAIINPPPGLPVLPGPIFQGGACHIPDD